MSQRIISFHYTLTDPSGKTIDSSVGQDPLTYLEGKGQIIPGLENNLQKMKVSDKKRVTVPSAEAYGPREERYVVKVPRGKLPAKDIKVGDQFQVSADPSGRPLTVITITESEVTLDANHPLAGIDLTFDVEIIDVREATAEELAHGHSHGPGGHGH
jgi:FKBP-type peptidyl-prolyl cis-trans isomerase SlyD